MPHDENPAQSEYDTQGVLDRNEIMHICKISQRAGSDTKIWQVHSTMKARIVLLLGKHIVKRKGVDLLVYDTFHGAGGDCVLHIDDSVHPDVITVCEEESFFLEPM